MKNIIQILFLFILIYSCNTSVSKDNDQTHSNLATHDIPHAGFRYSEYGPKYNPGPAYWLSVGNRISSNFKNCSPQCVWIVGVLKGEGVSFNFPVETDNELIQYSSVDLNEETFELFDKNGVEVWLQVEPGNAPVEDLIHAILKRYSHHKCIVGVGVNVEWYKSIDKAAGKAVTDEEARNWLRIAQSYKKKYRLFLKHWLVEKMPPTERKDIVFVNDSQQLGSLQNMTDEFIQWSNAFQPAKVSFQVGYESDRIWWRKLVNPPQVIGNTLMSNINNMEALFWVDFTILSVFPE